MWTDNAKAGGGGFLNNVDGVIVDYEFTRNPPYEVKDDSKSPFFMILTVAVDGAEEPVTTTLRGGGGEFFDIIEDGKVLVSVDADRVPKLWDKSDIFRFLVKLEGADFPTSRFPDPNESKTIDLRPMIGTRVRFVQTPVTDDKGKALKSKPKTSGPHKGKSFTVTELGVSKVLALPDADGTSDDAEQSAADQYAAADAFLLGMVAEATGKKLKRDGFNLAATRYAGKKKIDGAVRDAMLATLRTDEYLGSAVERGVIALDGKTGIVTAAA